MSMFNKCHIHLCDCTWLNVFSHAQSLLIKHKNIFECFSCFWKVFCFCEKCQNFKKKNSVALFWRLNRGLVQSNVLIASPHRDFSWLTGRSMPQLRKILRIFFKIWVFNVSHDSVWRLVRGWKVQSREGSEIFPAYLTAYLATFSRVELPVAKKHLENFFKFLF